MNNRGQSLVLFVCLLPVVICLFAYLFDTAYIAINNSKLNNIAEISVKYAVLNKDLSSIKEVIYANDEDIKIISITSNEVVLEKKLKPIFGSIVGYDSYNLKADLYGSIDNNKLIIHEKG